VYRRRWRRYSHRPNVLVKMDPTHKKVDMTCEERLRIRTPSRKAKTSTSDLPHHVTTSPRSKYFHLHTAFRHWDFQYTHCYQILTEE